MKASTFIFYILIFIISINISASDSKRSNIVPIYSDTKESIDYNFTLRLPDMQYSHEYNVGDFIASSYCYWDKNEIVFIFNIKDDENYIPEYITEFNLNKGDSFELIVALNSEIKTEERLLFEIKSNIKSTIVIGKYRDRYGNFKVDVSKTEYKEFSSIKVSIKSKSNFFTLGKNIPIFAIFYDVDSDNENVIDHYYLSNKIEEINKIDKYNMDNYIKLELGYGYHRVN